MHAHWLGCFFRYFDFTSRPICINFSNVETPNFPQDETITAKQAVRMTTTHTQRCVLWNMHTRLTHFTQLKSVKLISNGWSTVVLLVVHNLAWLRQFIIPVNWFLSTLNRLLIPRRVRVPNERTGPRTRANTYIHEYVHTICICIYSHMTACTFSWTVCICASSFVCFKCAYSVV